MSTVTEPELEQAEVNGEPMTTVDSPFEQIADSGWANESGNDEFDYVPVSPFGPVALVLGLCSLTGLTNSVFGLVLALIGRLKVGSAWSVLMRLFVL